MSIMDVLPVNLMLYDVQSGVNVGQVLRTCEMFQVWLQIYDPRKVLEDEQRRMTASDFSCGALERFNDVLVDDFAAYRKANKGRIIATAIGKSAVPLTEFEFKPGDTVLMGNEYDGLPDDVVAKADVNLFIPLPNGVVHKPRSKSPIDPSRAASVAQNGIPNLSVSIASSIMAFAIHAQRMRMLENALRSDKTLAYNSPVRAGEGALGKLGKSAPAGKRR